ncbi:MAG TPA: N,N-dimethylformamidase beta subunit family domain-containing protein, partial [Ktedonobacterales bacterium]|nr:N,N-dimethylformamidase beta subunit family domain-containing protein [Ktedonobacterales bacterium]
RVIISGGHDEYWTKSMRDGMEAARDHGVSIAFFGANAAYWQARLEPDHAGTANRTLTCFKVNGQAKTPQAGMLSLDPLYHDQPEAVTAQWRDPALNRPENALLGLMYSSYISFIRKQGYYLPDWVVKAGNVDRLMEGTGLTSGKHIKGGLLGYEYDVVVNNGHTPASLVVLAESPIINVYGKQQLAHSAYYRADSGAMVFDAGTVWWGWGLSEKSPQGAYQANRLKGNESIKALTRNIIDAMLHVAPAVPTVTPLPDPAPSPTP